MNLTLSRLYSDLITSAEKNNIPKTCSGFYEFPQAALLSVEEANTITRIIPRTHFCEVSDGGHSVICNYENDVYGWRHMLRRRAFYEKAKNVVAMCGHDFSVCIDAPQTVQRMYALLNQLLDIEASLYGVKIIPNLRLSFETLQMLECYPQGGVFSLGTIGCAKGLKEINEPLLRYALQVLKPSLLLVYGKLPSYGVDILNNNECAFKQFVDYRTSCFQAATMRKVG